MSDKVKFTDEMIAKARQEIGRERPARAHWNEVTADAIRHFALGIGDDNPLWLSKRYAAESVGSVLAPPTFLWTSFMTPMFFPSESKARSTGGGLPGMQALFAGCRFRFNRPIKPGDKLRATSTRRGIVDPSVRVDGDCTDPRADLVSAYAAMDSYNPNPGGRAVFQIETHACIDVETGETIGDLIEHAARVEPEAIDPKLGKWGSFEPRKYTEAEMRQIGEQYAQEAGHRRGDRPRFWEDVQIGEQLPRLIKGPMTILSYTAFFAGFAAFFNLTDRVLYNFASRFGESVKVDPETGIWLLPEEMHWHPEMTRLLGMPYGFDVGSQRISWLAHLVTDWMGDAAWMTSLDVWFQRPMFLTEAAWISGHVVSKDTGAAGNQVVIELSAETFDGELLSTGTAVVSLPTMGEPGPVWRSDLREGK
jgi:acyl dehydratase